MGKTYFMYHAYNAQSNVYVGRQALLSEIVWNKKGWPEIKEDTVTVKTISTQNFSDDFTTNIPTWRWPVEYQPAYKTENGFLALTGSKEGAVLAQATLSDSYVAITRTTIQQHTYTGLSAFGDMNNAIGISANKDTTMVWQVQSNKRMIVAQVKTPAVDTIQFKLVTQPGQNMEFFYSIDGKAWMALGGAQNGSFLPPWDRSVRVALISLGSEVSYFDWFKMKEL
jgi:hypothetical protein